jgi:uncharacterized protein
LSIYPDTSVVVALVTRDALTKRALAWLETEPGAFVLSDFSGAEFASAIGIKLRRGELTRSEAEGAFTRYDSLVASMGPASRLRTEDVAQVALWLRRLDLVLRTPDAIHLAIASKRGLPVATFDKGMATAADILGVSCILIR